MAALRRPPKSAWALNRLAREQPDRVENVLGSASSLAEALESGDDLRGAQQAYRDAIHAAVEQAAADAGIDSEQLRSRMRDTLFAAGASAEVAATLRTGTLADDEPARGFGVGPAKHDEASRRARSGGRARSTKAPGKGRSKGKQAQADEAPPVDELAERRAARRREAEDRVRELEADLEQQAAQAEELRDAAAVAEEEAEAARRRAEAATTEAEEARTRQARLAEDLQAARDQLDEL